MEKDPPLSFIDEFGDREQEIRKDPTSRVVSGRISRPQSPIIIPAKNITVGFSPLPFSSPGEVSRIGSPRPRQRPKSPRDETPIVLDGRIVNREEIRSGLPLSPETFGNPPGPGSAFRVTPRSNRLNPAPVLNHREIESPRSNRSNPPSVLNHREIESPRLSSTSRTAAAAAVPHIPTSLVPASRTAATGPHVPASRTAATGPHVPASRTGPRAPVSHRPLPEEVQPAVSYRPPDLRVPVSNRSPRLPSAHQPVPVSTNRFSNKSGNQAAIVDMISHNPPPTIDPHIIIATPATESVEFNPNNIVPSQSSVPDINQSIKENNALRPRYDLLSKVSGVKLPPFDETNYPLNLENFKREERLKSIRQKASFFRIAIMAYAYLIEWFCSSILNIDMSGFLVNQVQILSDYDTLVFEIAESWTGEGSGTMRPEYRFLILVMVNSVIFAIAKVITNKLNINVYPIIRGLQGATVPSGNNNGAGGMGGFDLGSIIGALAGAFGGGNSGNRQPSTTAPKSESTPTRRMPVYEE
jgi:hypothetical protein